MTRSPPSFFLEEGVKERGTTIPISKDSSIYSISHVLIRVNR